MRKNIIIFSYTFVYVCFCNDAFKRHLNACIDYTYWKDIALKRCPGALPILKVLQGLKSIDCKYVTQNANY